VVKQGPCRHRYYAGVVIGGEGGEGEWWSQFVSIMEKAKGARGRVAVCMHRGGDEGVEEEERFIRRRSIGLGVFGFIRPVWAEHVNQ
jgi:hypothetical protein